MSIKQSFDKMLEILITEEDLSNYKGAKDSMKAIFYSGAYAVFVELAEGSDPNPFSVIFKLSEIKKELNGYFPKKGETVSSEKEQS